MTLWVHYWKRERAEEGEGTYVGHTASSVFRQRGVKAGDRMYVISVLGGRLRVIGRLDVEDVVTQSRAEELFGRRLWEAPDHVVARPGSGTPRRLDAFVPTNRLGDVELIGPDGAVNPLKLNRLDQIDVLSLQGLREITARSAALFDQLLGLKPEMDIAVKGADSI